MDATSKALSQIGVINQAADLIYPTTTSPIWAATWNSPVSRTVNPDLFVPDDFTRYNYVKPMVGLYSPGGRLKDGLGEDGNPGAKVEGPGNFLTTQRFSNIVSALQSLPAGQRVLRMDYYDQTPGHFYELGDTNEGIVSPLGFAGCRNLQKQLEYSLFGNKRCRSSVRLYMP